MNAGQFVCDPALYALSAYMVGAAGRGGRLPGELSGQFKSTLQPYTPQTYIFVRSTTAGSGMNLATSARSANPFRAEAKSYST